MLSNFHIILVELAFEVFVCLFLKKFMGSIGLILHGNIMGLIKKYLGNILVNLDQFSIHKQVHIQEWYFSKWLY